MRTATNEALDALTAELVPAEETISECFLNLNATGFIIVREVGQSKDGGAWDKLINFTLSRWQDGNRNPKEIERLSGGKIRLKAAPKGPGTVAARSRMLMEMFAQQEVVISALCTKTIDMCEFMEGQKAPKDAYDPDAWLTPKAMVGSSSTTN